MGRRKEGHAGRVLERLRWTGGPRGGWQVTSARRVGWSGSVRSRLHELRCGGVPLPSCRRWAECEGSAGQDKHVMGSTEALDRSPL